MALPPLAAVEDMAQFAGLDQERVPGALAAASALVRAYTGRSFTDSAGELIDVPDEVVQATIFVARRVVMMPASGVSDESAGPFSVKRDSSMWLSATERIMLSRWVIGAGFSTLTTRGPISDSHDRNWFVPVHDGGDLVEFPD